MGTKNTARLSKLLRMHDDELVVVNAEWQARLDGAQHQVAVGRERVRQLECDLSVQSVYQAENARLQRDLKALQAELDRQEQVRERGSSSQPVVPNP